MSSTDSISYILNEDKTDIRRDVKVTINSYMSDLVSHNATSPDLGIQETHLTRAKSVTGGGQSEAFATPERSPEIERISDSAIIFRPTIASYIKKGISGNTVLPEVESLMSKSPAVYPVSEFLESQPTSPSDPYKKFGVEHRYGPKRVSVLGSHDPQAPELTFDELFSIGTKLLESATADIQSAGTSGRSAIDKASLGTRKFPVAGLLDTSHDMVPDTRLSFGTSNSPAEPFTDDPVGLDAKMSEAAKSAVEQYMGTVSHSMPASLVTSTAIPGTSLSAQGQFLTTHSDFQRAVVRGMQVFYSTPIQPGYRITISRAIVRALSSASNGHDPSQAVSILNIFASIGDRALQMEASGFDPTVSRSTIDMMPDTSVTRISKSRDKNRGLAWRTSVLPSIYLLPDQVITAFEDFTGHRGSELLAGPAGAKMALGEGTRISADSVQRIETLLDSEYVPFYFHDIRTNEIIAFHAFLESLSDSYVADYEETDAYGRVDSVMIYGKTKRNISLEFNIVSTNPDDFDEMWWKINKLTTLLYPQWSTGRVSSTSDATFVQPFSQVPAASPLIRLRLGDVIKGNYSRFNLARIFGLGTTNFNVGATSNSADVNIDILVSVRLRMSSDPAVVGTGQGGFKTGEQAYLRPEPRGIGWKSVDGTAAPLITSTNILITFVDSGTIISDSGRSFTLYKVSVTDPEALSVGINPGPYYVSGHENFVIYENQVILSAGVSVEIESQRVSDTQNFFSPDPSATGGGNSIVRSFESTMGKGLAGVITNMSFEWLNATWELGPGQTAPKVCKVKCEFKPIHDIAPGLDSNGFNRAPIYPVGRSVGRISPDIYIEKAAQDYRRRSFAVDKTRSA